MVDVVRLKSGEAMPSQIEDYVQVVRDLAPDGSQKVRVRLTVQRHSGEPDEGFVHDEERTGLSYDEMTEWAVDMAKAHSLEKVIVQDNTIQAG